jgi:hypothetical protein
LPPNARASLSLIAFVCAHGRPMGRCTACSSTPATSSCGITSACVQLSERATVLLEHTRRNSLA